MKSPTTSPPPPSPIPLVIQLGFAGARELVDTNAFPDADPTAYSAAAEGALFDVLQSLPLELGLVGHRVFFCGISQLAIGADLQFIAALHRHGSLHRAFLPQPLDGYLSAMGSRGPDFTAEQQARVKALLEHPGTIQTRVASNAADRHERFRETNEEIARVSDLVICLQRARQDGKPGGTQELAELARRRKRPVITLEIAVGPDGQPVVTRPSRDAEKAALAAFRPPPLPEELTKAKIAPLPVQPLPASRDYIKVLKDANSAQANKLRLWFKWAALFIVLGHILATVMAVVAMKVNHGVALILGAELLLLLLGLLVHSLLHHTRSLGRWAACRLMAEVARSLQALGKFPVYLQHFFALPFPAEFRPLLRTLSVLHLRDTAGSGTRDWQASGSAYVHNRLVDPAKKAQIPYHTARRDSANRWLARTHHIFYAGSLGAVTATTLKLLTHANWLPVSQSSAPILTAVLGALAILLPVIAVAALSLALAFDQEAKEHTSSDLLAFLVEQKKLLESAESPGELGRLVIETESRLLGESVNWYARRSFVGVA